MVKVFLKNSKSFELEILMSMKNKIDYKRVTDYINNMAILYFIDKRVFSLRK